MRDIQKLLSLIGVFARRLREPRQCYFLAFQSLVTGSAKWKIRSWLAHRALQRLPPDDFEVGDQEQESQFESWMAIDNMARFGSDLRDSKELRNAVLKLTLAGVCEAKVRCLIVNGYLRLDGSLQSRKWSLGDRVTSALGWAWHALVLLIGVLLLALIWSLPGTNLAKITVSTVLAAMFLLSSALMNSVSLSRLPPNPNSLMPGGRNP